MIFRDLISRVVEIADQGGDPAEGVVVVEWFADQTVEFYRDDPAAASAEIQRLVSDLTDAAELHQGAPAEASLLRAGVAIRLFAAKHGINLTP